MSASPFRSHLLQQWARTNQKRPPVAVVPWLKPTSGSKASDSEDDDSLKSSRRHRHHDQHGSSRPSRHGPPSLSSVDSNSYISKSSWTESCESSRKSARAFSSVASIPHSPSSASLEGEIQNQDSEDDDDGHLASSLQSLLLDRRTATRLTFTMENREAEKEHLLEALDRAVACAQMAPNHKRTEPFSFKRFLASSQAAKDLAEITYQVALAKTNSVHNAEGKRNKWLEIPAFLVASVHKNQRPIEQTASTTSPYQALPFMPPENEQQLEDYASASAAIQNVLLSLHSEGIGSKWATGPVIRTLAFRELVCAAPSDRIVGLIMVGGTTDFQNDREEFVTKSRRQRRRALHGDLLQNLP